MGFLNGTAAAESSESFLCAAQFKCSLAGEKLVGAYLGRGHVCMEVVILVMVVMVVMVMTMAMMVMMLVIMVMIMVMVMMMIMVMMVKA